MQETWRGGSRYICCEDDGSRMIEFTASRVAFEEVDGVFIVALAEHGDGDGAHVMFQSGPTDEQDVALGMDTYCICTDNGACHYGGIASWRIAGGELEIELDEQAKRVLGCDGFRVRIPADDEGAVRDGLERILAN